MVLEHHLKILYTDVIFKVLNRAMREELHSMIVDGYEIQSPFFIELIESWKAEGVEQGLKQGQREGRQQALESILNARFGALSDPTREQLSLADVKTLDAWLIAAITAPTLEAVFEAEPQRK